MSEDEKMQGQMSNVTKIAIGIGIFLLIGGIVVILIKKLRDTTEKQIEKAEGKANEMMDSITFN